VLALSRRTFLKAIAAAAAPRSRAVIAVESVTRETLYNGITLASPWPPHNRFFTDAPSVPPYLADPPAVIPIDVGRQLFVDDFLIEERTLGRTYHAASYHPASPVLQPMAGWERAAPSTTAGSPPIATAAMPYSDGAFFDPADGLFKMWYMGGYGQHTCLATSEDGIAWRRPAFDVLPGSNVVSTRLRDSNTVWLDLNAPHPSERFKMATFNGSHGRLLFYASADGVHWSPAGESGPTGDRSTMFYNPFRAVWVFSLRDDRLPGFGRRFRRYWESTTFGRGRSWNQNEPVLWTAADRLDPPRQEYRVVPELYNLDGVAYESLMLGLFTMFRGERAEREKPNEVFVGFSRDGFHWWRPHRQPFIGVSEHVGDWNWANVQSAGGCCLVVRDQLYFYVSGRRGMPGTSNPGECSTGLAVMRRDGFASVDDDPSFQRPVRVGRGPYPYLTTRPVRFSGQHLFVNADVSHGELRVEVLDREGRTIPTCSAERCSVVAGVDATRIPISWSGRPTLSDLRNTVVRFRFLVKSGRLFSFWVTSSPDGASHGYVAAGGPGFRGTKDG
jgi:hypothetical protein